MNIITRPILRIALLGMACSAIGAFAQEPVKWDNDPEGVQVFILAGQSNMVGHGKVEEGHGDVKGAIGGLRYQVKNDPENYAHLVDKDGQWIVRDDVKVWWRDSEITAPRAVLKGDLKIGYSQSRNPGWIGPEYGFGWVMGEHFKDQPVLLVKIAWGGKSLHTDFRPPSAVAARGGEVGPYYKAILEYTRDALENMGTEFPELKGKGYRIAGFGWHQGWNDRVDATASAEYEKNLADFIRDIRKDFGNPKLPVSITTTSMAPGPEPSTVELAQLAVANPKKYPVWQKACRSLPRPHANWPQGANAATGDPFIELSIPLCSRPEVISGSTRMKAGTKKALEETGNQLTHAIQTLESEA